MFLKHLYVQTGHKEKVVYCSAANHSGDVCEKNKQKKTSPVNMSGMAPSPPESFELGFLSSVAMISRGLRNWNDP